MTREEIKSIVRQGSGTLDFELSSDAFKTSLPQNIYKPILNWTTGERETDIDKLVTDYITDCVNSFLSLDRDKFIERLKEDIFRFFNICIEAASYGQVPDELVTKHGNTEANRIFFKGHDKESVYSNCKFHYVYYTNDSGPKLRFSIHIKIDWDMEHGLTIFFENGKYVNIE